MPTMRVPLGIGIGFSRSNPSCQLKSHFALKIVSDLPDGIDQANFVVVAPQMHVRLHVDQLRVGLRGHFGHDFRVAVAGRNGEIRAVGPSCVKYRSLGGCFANTRASLERSVVSLPIAV